MRAVVWGLGTHGGGAAATRRLVTLGYEVTVVDRRDQSDLEPADLPSTVDLVGGVADPTPWLAAGVELVVNPAVPPSHPSWPAIERSGCRLTSELGLLLDALGGRPVLAVTGSNGKSTVAAWTAALLKTDAIGGNFETTLLGLKPLLDRVDSLKPDAPAVLELSSFHLARLAPSGQPFAAAAVTNVTPNHLDWHGDLASYEAAKSSVADRTGGPIFGHREVAFPEPLAAAMTQSDSSGPEGWPDHVRRAAGLARSLAETTGVAITGDDLVATRPCLRHRLSDVPVESPLRFVDDSASTTPESTSAALDALGPHCVLIAGGRNKGFDVDAFARSVAARAAAVATIGEVGSDLATRVAVHGGKVRSHRTLAQAVRWAAKVCPPGGTVLLSPGMASTDQFADSKARGGAFAAAAEDAVNRAAKAAARNSADRDSSDLPR